MAEKVRKNPAGEKDGFNELELKLLSLNLAFELSRTGGRGVDPSAFSDALFEVERRRTEERKPKTWLSLVRAAY